MPCDGRSYLELYCLLYGISVDVKETAKPRYAYENDKPDRGHGQHTRSIVINSPWHASCRVLTTKIRLSFTVKKQCTEVQQC